MATPFSDIIDIALITIQDYKINNLYNRVNINNAQNDSALSKACDEFARGVPGAGHRPHPRRRPR